MTLRGILPENDIILNSIDSTIQFFSDLARRSKQVNNEFLYSLLTLQEDLEKIYVEAKEQKNILVQNYIKNYTEKLTALKKVFEEPINDNADDLFLKIYEVKNAAANLPLSKEDKDACIKMGILGAIAGAIVGAILSAICIAAFEALFCVLPLFVISLVAGAIGDEGNFFDGELLSVFGFSMIVAAGIGAIVGLFLGYDKAYEYAKDKQMPQLAQVRDKTNKILSEDKIFSEKYYKQLFFTKKIRESSKNTNTKLEMNAIPADTSVHSDSVVKLLRSP